VHRLSFKFAANRKIGLYLPLFGIEDNEPTGMLKSLVDKKFGDKNNFLDKLRAPTQEGLNA
tara:strand:- start:13717 stop:13899 length:183 start_codon:yes stop_codon:yes gene_type:complete